MLTFRTKQSFLTFPTKIDLIHNIFEHLSAFKYLYFNDTFLLILTIFIAVSININMNFSQCSHPQESSITSENDLQKLINICNSYGLNNEETNQIISEFRRGALYSQPSLNDSLNQSLSDMTFNQKNNEQQYSFKHGKQSVKQQSRLQQLIKLQQQEEQSQMNEINHTGRESGEVHANGLQKLLFEKMSIEKGLISNIQEENQSLKRNVQEKEATIQELINMKRQDSEIILGLKDIISNMTSALKQKDNTLKDLQQKYNQLMQSRVNQLSQRRSMVDVVESSMQDISNSNCTKKQSKVKQTNLQSKDTKSTMSIEMPNVDLKKSKQPNRIDIKKYKEMIENMRSNY